MTLDSFSPTVLIVDDDPAVLDLATRRFYKQTSLGVLVADNLADARHFLEDAKIRINAILADISIMPEKQDQMSSLHDGLDFLAYAKKSFVGNKMPNVPAYVLSVYADVRTYRQRSVEMGLDVKEWFQKLSFDDNLASAPWNRIERDLYRMRFCSDPAMEKKFGACEGSDNDFAELVRNTLRPITRTYLQALPDRNLLVKVPIEVICRQEDHCWLADALHLGVLQAGAGDSVEEALDDLSQLIEEQFRTFQNAELPGLEGFAEEAFRALRRHIVPRIQ